MEQEVLTMEGFVKFSMETPIHEALPPDGIQRRGKTYYSVWDNIFEIDARYVPIKPLGSGAYGVVCSMLDQMTNEMVAIKKISNVFENPTTAVRTLREIKILRHVGHPNVISLKNMMVPTLKAKFTDIYLVFELMDADLNHVIRSPKPLFADQIKSFMLQILRGLHYIHSNNILHQDLKPSNILVNSNGDLKIGDFGLARTAAKDEAEFMTGYVVSRWYRAPEVLLGSYHYGQPIDVWSVGCIFAELLGQAPFFPGMSTKNQLLRVLNVLGTQKQADLEFIRSAKARRYIESLPYRRRIPLASLFPLADPLGLDLLEKMLVFDPKKRITTVEALKHPYLADIYDPSVHCPAQSRVNFDVEWGLKEDAMRKLMWDEIVSCHRHFAQFPSFFKFDSFYYFVFGIGIGVMLLKTVK